LCKPISGLDTAQGWERRPRVDGERQSCWWYLFSLARTPTRAGVNEI